MDDKLHAMLLPDVGAAAARARSRSLRPGGVALPGDREDATGPPTCSEAGRHEGWTRVALVEDEIRPDNDALRGGTLTRVASGLWSGEPRSGDEPPFETVSTEWRWHDDPQPGASDGVAPSGPLTVRGTEEHLVLFDALLTLTPGWMARLGVRPAPLPAPLDLFDEHGARGAVVRYWRMRPYSYGYAPLTPMIRGAELLLRPDLAEAVSAATTGRLAEVTRVLRHDLPS
jgi:hypothetical protein